MTKTQIILMNCYMRFMKEWVELYSSNFYKYELSSTSLKIYTGSDQLDWQILEKMESITKNCFWEVYINEDKLIIKIWK